MEQTERIWDAFVAAKLWRKLQSGTGIRPAAWGAASSRDRCCWRWGQGERSDFPWMTTEMAIQDGSCPAPTSTHYRLPTSELPLDAKAQSSGSGYQESGEVGALHRASTDGRIRVRNAAAVARSTTRSTRAGTTADAAGWGCRFSARAGDRDQRCAPRTGDSGRWQLAIGEHIGRGRRRAPTRRRFYIYTGFGG